jgi:hypothetical protein
MYAVMFRQVENKKSIAPVRQPASFPNKTDDHHPLSSNQLDLLQYFYVMLKLFICGFYRKIFYSKKNLMRASNDP